MKICRCMKCGETAIFRAFRAGRSYLKCYICGSTNIECEEVSEE